MLLLSALGSFDHISKLTIEDLTSYPLRQVLQKLEASGHLLKWAVELGQFDIHFRPRTTIKGQALADFITEFTY